VEKAKEQTKAAVKVRKTSRKVRYSKLYTCEITFLFFFPSSLLPFWSGRDDRLYRV